MRSRCRACVRCDLSICAYADRRMVLASQCDLRSAIARRSPASALIRAGSPDHARNLTCQPPPPATYPPPTDRQPEDPEDGRDCRRRGRPHRGSRDRAALPAHGAARARPGDGGEVQRRAPSIAWSELAAREASARNERCGIFTRQAVRELDGMMSAQLPQAGVDLVQRAVPGHSSFRIERIERRCRPCRSWHAGPRGRGSI